MSQDSRDVAHRAAQALRDARAARHTIGPISVSHGVQGLEAAYTVAAINTKVQLDAGRRIVGKKVGLTSKAVQLQLGVVAKMLGHGRLRQADDLRNSGGRYE